MIKTLYLIALGATNLSLLNTLGLLLIETVELKWFLSFEDTLKPTSLKLDSHFSSNCYKTTALDLQHFCNHTKAHGYIVRMTACQSLETNKSRLAKRRFIT